MNAFFTLVLFFLRKNNAEYFEDSNILFTFA